MPRIWARAEDDRQDGGPLPHLHDQTFEWLEKAYAGKSEGLQFVRIAKAMDKYRSDPRYLDLVKRMGFTPWLESVLTPTPGSHRPRRPTRLEPGFPSP